MTAVCKHQRNGEKCQYCKEYDKMYYDIKRFVAWPFLFLRKFFKNILRQARQNKGFTCLFLASLALAICDFYFTLSLGHEFIQHLETNILFKLSGSLWPIVLINVLFFIMVWWAYVRPKSGVFGRYFLITVLLGTGIGRAFAIKNAMAWQKVIPSVTVEQVAAVSTQAAHIETMVMTAWLVYLPLFFAVVAFLIWLVDHTVTRKEVALHTVKKKGDCLVLGCRHNRKRRSKSFKWW